MLNPLGALVITFFAMSIISLIGVILMFAIKNKKWKDVAFYFLSFWGMTVAYCNVLSLPSNWLGEILIAVALGALSVAGLLIKLCGKSNKSEMIAKVLVAVSVIAGMIDCFLM